jgi:hypothetical protein
MKSSHASAGERVGTGEIGSLTQLDLRHNLPAPQNHAATAATSFRQAVRVSKKSATGCPAQSRSDNGDEWVGAHPPSGGRHFFASPEAASIGLETGANSSLNAANHKPRSSRALVLTFCDAALHFVTSRRQNRGGAGGRPVYFLPEAAPE